MTGGIRATTLLAVASSPALAVELGASRIALSMDSSKSPVDRVTALLKGMQSELEKDAEADKEAFDKMACWCTTGDTEKTTSIAYGKQHIQDLGTQIEELTALTAKLSEEIDHTNAEVAANMDALEKATNMREEELAAFKEEETFLMSSIDSVSGAIDALSKHNGASFVQVAKSLRSVMGRQGRRSMGHLRGAALTPEQQHLLVALQEQAADGQPVAVNSYDSQSGQIFGVLSQMKETFEQDLAGGRDDESKAQNAYEALKAGKEAEIAAGQKLVNTKTQERADTDEQLANAKVDLEDTTNAKAADEEFLAMLKEKCALTSKEYEERLKMRQEEVTAVSKALGVFTGDAAKDLFHRTFSLVQSGAETHSERRQRASQLLAATGTRFRNAMLSQLAVRVRLDAFTKVKKAIDDMMAELLKQKEAEIKHKDFCNDELNTNQLQTEQKERLKTDQLTKMEELQTTMNRLTDEINTLKAEVGDLQLQLKRVGEDREAESRLFQTTVADQRSTQKLLNAALTILQDEYGKSFLQQPVGAPPPEGFSAMKKNPRAGGVVAAIQQIIEDTQAMEKEAVKTEEDAQATYAAYVMETNASIEAKDKGIADRTEERAKNEVEFTETKEAKDFTVSELGNLAIYNAELHKSCDYVLKNFDVRQNARDEEVEALKQAKAILSGAKA